MPQPLFDRSQPPRPQRGRLRLALLLMLPPALHAQADRAGQTITLIVPFAPGGIADLSARVVAQAMALMLKRPVIVDNRPSAGAIVGSTAVAKATPDGQTLLLLSNANAVSVGLYKKLPYDPVKDFVPIGTLGFFDLGLFVAAASRWQKLEQVLEHARANPGKLTIGTIAAGSTQHLAAELFKAMAGVDALVVPYKGTPAVTTALRGGEIDLAFEIIGPLQGQLQAQAVRALAVTSAQRFAGLPDVPTVQESGVPGYDVSSWNALAAPVGTPRAMLEQLNQALREALASVEVQRQLLVLGVRTQGGSPQQLAALLDGEIKRWSAVIRAAKIEPQ